MRTWAVGANVGAMDDLDFFILLALLDETMDDDALLPLLIPTVACLLGCIFKDDTDDDSSRSSWSRPM